MITQEFKNGTSTITIENATSKDDAEKNKFPEGVFSRIFIDGKPTEYMGMVQHIIANSKSQENKFVTPSQDTIHKMQQDMIEKQKKDFKEMIKKMKQQYGQAGAPENEIKKLDDIVDKVDAAFVRIKK